MCCYSWQLLFWSQTNSGQSGGLKQYSLLCVAQDSFMKRPEMWISLQMFTSGYSGNLPDMFWKTSRKTPGYPREANGTNFNLQTASLNDWEQEHEPRWEQTAERAEWGPGYTASQSHSCTNDITDAVNMVVNNGLYPMRREELTLPSGGEALLSPALNTTWPLRSLPSRYMLGTQTCSPNIHSSL